MGEIADMMIDGTLDWDTGEYIDGESPGYPRRVRGGNFNKTNKEKGVRKFLTRKGLSKKEGDSIIREYTSKREEHLSLRSRCLIISSEFDKFVEWFKNKNSLLEDKR